MNEFIVTAIWQAASAAQVVWTGLSAAVIASSLDNSADFLPFANYAAFRAEALMAGADAAELTKLYRNAAFFDEFQNVLQSGDLARLDAARADFGYIEDYADMAGATKTAANTALVARERSWLDVAAAGAAVDAPESVTAAEVTAALNAAGYSWNGSAWVQS